MKLQDLPNEVLDIILKHSDANALCVLNLTSKRLHSLASQRLWSTVRLCTGHYTEFTGMVIHPASTRRRVGMMLRSTQDVLKLTSEPYVSRLQYTRYLEANLVKLHEMLKTKKKVMSFRRDKRPSLEELLITIVKRSPLISATVVVSEVGQMVYEPEALMVLRQLAAVDSVELVSAFVFNPAITKNVTRLALTSAYKYSANELKLATFYALKSFEFESVDDLRNLGWLPANLETLQFNYIGRIAEPPELTLKHLKTLIIRVFEHLKFVNMNFPALENLTIMGHDIPSADTIQEAFTRSPRVTYLEFHSGSLQLLADVIEKTGWKLEFLISDLPGLTADEAELDLFGRSLLNSSGSSLRTILMYDVPLPSSGAGSLAGDMTRSIFQSDHLQGIHKFFEALALFPRLDTIYFKLPSMENLRNQRYYSPRSPQGIALSAVVSIVKEDEMNLDGLLHPTIAIIAVTDWKLLKLNKQAVEIY